MDCFPVVIISLYYGFELSSRSSVFTRNQFLLLFTSFISFIIYGMHNVFYSTQINFLGIRYTFSSLIFALFSF